MKDNLKFCKNLRNYEDHSQKSIPYINSNSKDLILKNKSFSTFKTAQILDQQEYLVNEYYDMITPFQLRPKQKRKQNKSICKSKSRESYFSLALKTEIRKAFITNQIGPQNILHCKSLKKLQMISNDRSDQIKSLIAQKGLLIAENEYLKLNIINHTYQQQEYIQKIVQKEYEIQNLKENIKRKEQKIAYIQKEYEIQIKKLKIKHDEELKNIRKELSKVKIEKASQDQRLYMSHSTGVQKLQQGNQIIQQSSARFDPTTVNANGVGIYNIGHSNSRRSQRFPVLIQAISSRSSGQQTARKNGFNHKYKTYIGQGQDGYERRAYYTRTENQHLINQVEKEAGNTEINSFKRNIFKSYSSQRPFTNQKISTFVSKQQPSTYIYKPSTNQTEDQKPQFKSNLHQNLYSKNLTFECFKDSN